MARSTCFTKVADCFGWFTVLIVFSFFLLCNGLFQKKKKGMWLEIYFFFGKPREIFRDITLPLAISDKKRLYSWKKFILKTPEPKSNATGNSIFFLITPRNSKSFLTNLWKFCILFLWYPQKFHSLNPPPPTPLFVCFPGTTQCQKRYTEQTRKIFCYQLQKSHF